LFGINCLQTFIYYTRYEKDRLWMKLFVRYSDFHQITRMLMRESGRIVMVSLNVSPHS